MERMIRINLLPTRDAPKRQAAAFQIAAFAILFVVIAAVMLAVDIWQNTRISQQERTNSVVEDRIERIRRQIRDHDQIKARIDEIESKQRVIEELESGRTGPTFVMVELAKILSRSGSPTIDHDRYLELVRRSPGQAYDPNWDGRRLWLREFREESRAVELKGDALSHEDVAELLRRLTLSDYFYEVTLVNTKTESEEAATKSLAAGLSSFVSFEIRCRLRYEGLPAGAQPGAEPPAAAAPAQPGTGA